jgi:glycosyltransferase involved in cell wall biosynthesis
MKRAVLARIYSWPSAFLVVGKANRAYYANFGVPSERLIPCPHSIDVARFAEPAVEHEKAAAQWRRELGIADDDVVLLFAGKFERKKQPLALMQALNQAGLRKVVLLMVGSGEQTAEVTAIAAADPRRFRVLPFQNQSRMPIVYRLGDLYVLPSAYGETWGLGVNEALACGRPVLVSDRVGCAEDVVDASCGRIFPFGDSSAMIAAMSEMTADRNALANMRRAALRRAWNFDVANTEASVVEGLRRVVAR